MYIQSCRKVLELSLLSILAGATLVSCTKKTPEDLHKNIYPEVLNYPRPDTLTQTDTLILIKTFYGDNLFLSGEKMIGNETTIETVNHSFKAYMNETVWEPNEFSSAPLFSKVFDSDCEYNVSTNSYADYLPIVREYTQVDAVYFSLSLGETCDVQSVIDMFSPYYKDVVDLRDRKIDTTWNLNDLK